MLRISIEGDTGKSAVASLIEDLLVSHGFMVGANINTPRTREGAAAVARQVSAQDPRVVLLEVQNAKSETTRG